MSTLKVSTIKSLTASTPSSFQDTNGVEVGQLCRAWVNFNGSGTVAIRDSFNCSSITDNGTGDYTVNFAAAMPTANYGVMQSANQDSSYIGLASPLTLATGSVRMRTSRNINNAGTLYLGANLGNDLEIVCVAIFGD